MYQRKLIVLNLILSLLALGLFFIEIPNVFAQNYQTADTVRLKSNKDNSGCFIFSGSLGIATSDTMFKADYMSCQANIGYWKTSFLFPICINFTYNQGISKSPNTGQFDIHLTTFLPWGGGNIYLLPTLGPGISFGSKRDEESNDQNIHLKSFVSPSFLCEGEISIGLSDKFTVGIKGSISFNQERTLKGCLLTFRIFKPIQ